MIKVSNELLQDSGVDIEGYLAARIAQRLGRGEAKYLVQGSGAGTPLEPKGLEASVTETKNTAAIDKFTWQEILALKHSIDPAYRNSGTFRLVFNDNTLKMLSEMEDAQKRPLWLPEIVGVAPATVLNIPYVIDPVNDHRKLIHFLAKSDQSKLIYCFTQLLLLSAAYFSIDSFHRLIAVHANDEVNDQA